MGIDIKILNEKSLNSFGYNPSSSSETNKDYMPYIEFEVNGIVGTFKDKTTQFKNDVEIKWNQFEFIYYTNDGHCGGRYNEKRNTFPKEYNEILEAIIVEFVKEYYNMSHDNLMELFEK